jgi:hypothetical protein
MKITLVKYRKMKNPEFQPASLHIIMFIQRFCYLSVITRQLMLILINTKSRVSFSSESIDSDE